MALRAFCVRLLVSTVCSRSIHVASVNASFSCRGHSCVWLGHVFINSSIRRHLGCPHFWPLSVMLLWTYVHRFCVDIVFVLSGHHKECEPVMFLEGPFLPPCGVWTWGLKDLVNCCHPRSQPNEAWQGSWLGDHKTTSSGPAEEVTCQHVGTAWTKAGNEGGALQAVKRAGAPGKEEATGPLGQQGAAGHTPPSKEPELSRWHTLPPPRPSGGTLGILEPGPCHLHLFSYLRPHSYSALGQAPSSPHQPPSIPPGPSLVPCLP